MNVLAILGVILLLAFMVEALVEYIFGQIVAHVPVLQPYSWLLMYIALAAGVAGAFIYKFDLLYLSGQWLEAAIPHSPYGIALTGLAIGRGSNFIHDILSRFFNNKKPSG